MAPVSMPGLAERIRMEGSSNLRAPIPLDVQGRWPKIEADVIFTANTFHIMSWSAVESFFQQLPTSLGGGGRLCVYGPFRYGGIYTSSSNREFDLVLQARDSRSGLRDFEAVLALAKRDGFSLLEDRTMPANNQLLTFERASSSPA